MKTFSESNLEFQFPEYFGLRRFDTDRFYKKISGLGLKGVDFIFIDPRDDGHLYLMEVKNYETRITADGVFNSELKQIEDFSKTIAAKYWHSQRAIRVIQIFYERKWWYLLLRFMLKKSLQFQLDMVFWTKVFLLSKSKEKHTYILWLETQGEQKAYRQQLSRALARELGSEVNFKIAQRSAVFPIALQVR